MNTDRVTIRLKKTVTVTPPWQFPSVQIEAGEVVNCEPANNLPGAGKMWIVDPRVDADGYGCYLERNEYEFN